MIYALIVLFSCRWLPITLDCITLQYYVFGSQWNLIHLNRNDLVDSPTVELHKQLALSRNKIKQYITVHVLLYVYVYVCLWSYVLILFKTANTLFFPIVVPISLYAYTLDVKAVLRSNVKMTDNYLFIIDVLYLLCVCIYEGPIRLYNYRISFHYSLILTNNWRAREVD